MGQDQNLLHMTDVLLAENICTKYEKGLSKRRIVTYPFIVPFPYFRKSIIRFINLYKGGTKYGVSKHDNATFQMLSSDN